MVSLPLSQWLATFFSLLYIYFAYKNNTWCFLFGIIGCSIWAYEDFVNLNLKFDGFLQIFYVLMSFIGIYQWTKGGEHQKERPISRLTLFQNLIILFLGAMVTLGLGWIGKIYLSTNLPLLDAITTGFSIIATFLLVWRVLDNWIYWIVFDLLYIYIYFHQSAYLFIFIMIVYILMSFAGLYKWNLIYRSQPAN